MNYVARSCLGVLIAMNCFAESVNSLLPSNVVKVTKENNPKCVEFVVYQGELYCSTVVMDKELIDPQVIQYEKQNAHFDNRPWKAAWGKKTDQILTVEYIPAGDDINNWNELITSQFIPSKESITPVQYMNLFKDNLRKSGVLYQFNVIEEQSNQIIYEFKVDNPKNLIQDEIQKVVKGQDGIYILHYATKKSDMGEADRKKWVDNLKNSTLKN